MNKLLIISLNIIACTSIASESPTSTTPQSPKSGLPKSESTANLESFVVVIQPTDPQADAALEHEKAVNAGKATELYSGAPNVTESHFVASKSAPTSESKPELLRASAAATAAGSATAGRVCAAPSSHNTLSTQTISFPTTDYTSYMSAATSSSALFAAINLNLPKPKGAQTKSSSTVRSSVSDNNLRIFVEPTASHVHQGSTGSIVSRPAISPMHVSSSSGSALPTMDRDDSKSGSQLTPPDAEINKSIHWRRLLKCCCCFNNYAYFKNEK